MNQVSYFFDSLAKYNSEIVCPSCGSSNHTLVDRKYFVLRLFECQSCNLYYRHPVEQEAASEQFYQSDYTEKGDKLTTYMPNDQELQELKSQGFNAGSNRSVARLLPIFEAAAHKIQGTKIVDYGTSWGYISYQLKAAGMAVQSYEISRPRAKYGNEHLGLNIVSDVNELAKNNDIFFSSHVIEHVPAVSKMIEIGKSVLSPEGVFIAICPNGSPEYRASRPKNHHNAWGQVHPNFLNAAFYQNYFKDCPYYIGSFPFNTDNMKDWEKGQFVDDLSGAELLILVKPNATLSTK
jgi:2-polyprenyl-3-methyl-5-hydroxy-6-metoxy-1,4-benzoquinol methylase